MRIAEVTAASAVEKETRGDKVEISTKQIEGSTPPLFESAPTAPYTDIAVSLPTSKAIVTDISGGPQNLSAATGLANILNVLPPVPTFEPGRSTLTVATATKTIPTVVPCLLYTSDAADE